MQRSSIREWWKRSPVEKAASFRHRYWAAKTRIYYGPQFRSLGKRTVIYDPMMITHPEYIALGDQILIRDGVRLEVIRDRSNRVPELSIGSNTGIEQNVHIVCHSRIRIGAGVAIAARCAIVDVSHDFRSIDSNLRIALRIVDENSFVEIGDGAFLGYGAVILPNVRIGRNAVIGANSVVNRDVPDFGVAAGVPATLLEVYDQENRKWVRAARSPKQRSETAGGIDLELRR